MFVKKKKQPRQMKIAVAILGVLALSEACVQSQPVQTLKSETVEHSKTLKEKYKKEKYVTAKSIDANAEKIANAPRFTAPKSKTRLAILWTAEVQGYVAPCGCTAEPMGGVARYQALVEEAKHQYGERVLVLDAGNLLFEKLDDNHGADECQANARVHLLLSSYQNAGLAATTLGALDDVRGALWRDARLQKKNILTLGVNLPRAILGGAPYAKSKIFERGGLKIGVSGFYLADKSLLEVNEQSKKLRKILQNEVLHLKKQGAQAVVLLAQATRKQARLLLEGVAGVDVVLIGRRPGESPSNAETLSSGAVLLAAGAQAQNIGIAELELRGRKKDKSLPLDDEKDRRAQKAKRLFKKIERYQKQVAGMDAGARREFIAERIREAQEELLALKIQKIKPPKGAHLLVRSVALDRASAVDEKTFLALKKYEDAIPALVASCESEMKCAEPEKNMPYYVGAEMCAGCHRAANRFWQKQTLKINARGEHGKIIKREVGHVKAWDTLIDVGKESDRSCVGCHSIGFMEPGGYCKTSEVDFRTGVQCESCHGPGSQHITEGDPRYIPRPTVDERTCRGCHQVPHIPSTESFVYDEKLLHILGKGHGEKRALELQPK